MKNCEKHDYAAIPGAGSFLGKSPSSDQTKIKAYDRLIGKCVCYRCGKIAKKSEVKDFWTVTGHTVWNRMEELGVI